MPRTKLTKKEARKYLSNVKPEYSFWIHNGPIINTLKHLPKAIDHTDINTFRHHVNRSKDDFSRWIDEVIGDKKLATDLRKVRAKKDYLQKLKQRVRNLKKLATESTS